MNQSGMNSEIAVSSVKRRNLPSWIIELVYDNWIIGTVIAIYLTVGLIVDTIFDNEQIINIKFGYHWFDDYLFYFLSFYFFLYLFMKMFYAKRYTKTINWIASDFSNNYLAIERVIGFYLIYSLLNPFFSAFSSIKSHIPLFNYYYADEMLMKIDQFVHFGYHPWELLQPILGLPILTQFLDLSYSIWFFLLFGICTWMAISRFRRLRLQFFISFFMTWIILGNIMAIILSSVGPCYYGMVVDGQSPYADLMNYLNAAGYNQSTPLLALQNQKLLWNSFLSGVHLEFGGGISAMPSLHVAIAFLFVLVGMKIHKLLGVVFSYYALLIFLGSVHLGWHYAVDGYVAIVAVFTIWKMSDKILNFFGYPQS